MVEMYLVIISKLGALSECHNFIFAIFMIYLILFIIYTLTTIKSGHTFLISSVVSTDKSLSPISSVESLCLLTRSISSSLFDKAFPLSDKCSSLGNVGNFLIDFKAL